MSSEVPTCEWLGLRGNRYRFYIYRIGTRFSPVSGNYIYARWTPNGWVPVKIGQSENLERRISEHASQNLSFSGKGATHIHARAEAPQESRHVIETDLLDYYGHHLE
ncbi:MAG: hypothetical protein OXK81_07210 [Chloroflexota bacterium]|nr:hypothetical protein [Chloroflexota bacterium]MDE2931019.1 hypothetical protein [Chloroflexota bacterium]